RGYKLVNADCTILLQKPKIAPYILVMRQCLANILNVDPDRISVKATTTEGVGFVGREEAIAVYATVLIEKS
ncbi:MAG: 2-C-methyl-D-erythritol 2,4-cyclodiphosphate synthase, partial [Bacteroidales bacterium]